MAELSLVNKASGHVSLPNRNVSGKRSSSPGLVVAPDSPSEALISSTAEHPTNRILLSELVSEPTRNSFNQEGLLDLFQTRLDVYRRKVLPTSSLSAETNYSFFQYFIDGNLINANAKVSTNPNFNEAAYNYLKTKFEHALNILVDAFNSSKSDSRKGSADQDSTDHNPLDLFVGVENAQFESQFLKKLEEINPAALAAATISPFIDFSVDLTVPQKEKIFTYLLVLILLFTFDDIVADAKIPPSGDQTLEQVYKVQTNRVTDFVAKLIDVLFDETFNGDPSTRDSERATYLNGKKRLADLYRQNTDFFSEFLKKIMGYITHDIEFKNTIARQLKDYLNSVVQEATYQQLAISEGRPTNEEDFNRNRRVNGAVLPCLHAALAIAGVKVDSEQYILFRLNVDHAIDNITRFNDIRSATKEFSKGHDLTNLVGIYRAHSVPPHELGPSYFFQKVADEASVGKSEFVRRANDHIKTYLIAIESESRYEQENLEKSCIISNLRSKSSFMEIQLSDDVHSSLELKSLSHLIRAYQVIYNWMTGHEAWEFCGNRHGKFDITAEKLDDLKHSIDQEAMDDLESIT
ncbi:MAG: terpene synthase family protein, partial [Candidatus Margulisiibacteriota bacterium]